MGCTQIDKLHKKLTLSIYLSVYFVVFNIYVWIDVYQVLIAIFLYSGGQSCNTILLKNANKRSSFRMDLKYTTLLSSLISTMVCKLSLVLDQSFGLKNVYSSLYS